jgi:site-specific DNA-methyltransferase (adenine-specific)
MSKKIYFQKKNQDSTVEINGSNNNSDQGTVVVKSTLKVDINLIEPDPSVMEIYLPKNLKGLKMTMNLVKQLEPIKVIQRGEKYRIFDGISRYLAALELGWNTLDIQVFGYSDDEIQDRFVLHNFRTKRSYKELCRQAEVILGILGLSQGKRRVKIGDLSNGDQDFSLVGKDRFEIACEIIGADISASTLRRLIEVKDFEETGNMEEKGLKLMDRIESGEMKINQAHGVLSNYRKVKKEEGSNALTEALRIVKGRNFKLYNQSCENLDDIQDDSVNCVVISPPYFQLRMYPDGVRHMSKPQHGLEKTVDEYVQNEIEIYKNVYKKLKITGSLFVNISDSYAGGVNCLVIEKLILEMDKAGWLLNQKITWLKDNAKPHSIESKRLMPTTEYILHFIKDPKLFYFRDFKIWKKGENYDVMRGCKDQSLGRKRKKSTWSLKKPIERFRNFLTEQHVVAVLQSSGFNWAELKEIDQSFRHLAPFPSVIPLLPILLTTKTGDIVLDIFNGTSTTTAVALQLGRKVIGYDTDTESHLFAAKRLRLVEGNLPTSQEVIDFENEFLTDSDLDRQIAA